MPLGPLWAHQLGSRPRPVPNSLGRCDMDSHDMDSQGMDYTITYYDL